jgi:hypothetical protein
MYSGIEQVKPGYQGFAPHPKTGWTAHQNQSPNWGIITVPAQSFAHTAWTVGQGGLALPTRQQAEDVEMKE